MAKKPSKKTTTTVLEEEVEEGTREAGEPLPQDDSHITMGDANVTIGDGEEEDNRETPPGEEEPELVTITVGGQEMKVPQETADAYQAEMEENRASVETTPPVTETKEEDKGVNFEELLFTDPNAALKLHGDMIREQIKEELTGEYNRDKAQDQFWGSFYKENKELSEDDHIVKMVMTQNWDTLEGMKGKGARDKLAELTQKEILRLVKKNKASNPPKGGGANLEGGSTSQDTPTEPTDEPNADSKVTSLADALKQRRQQRNRSQRAATN